MSERDGGVVIGSYVDNTFGSGGLGDGNLIVKGQVGIGTTNTSASYKLDVSGNSRVGHH